MKISNPAILFWLSAAVAPSFITANLSCPAAVDYTQWKTGVGNNGHFYKHVVGDALTWEDARAAAEASMICGGAVKGHLTTLTTEEEDAFVFDLIDRDNYGDNTRGP
jgi:hypothetical protein